MKTLFSNCRLVVFLTVMIWSGVSGRAGEALTIAEALDTPGLEWSQSGTGRWAAKSDPGSHDGTDCVEISELYDGNGQVLTATLSTQINGPAVVRFWWRYIASVSDPAVGVAVDGAFTQLPSWQTQGPEGWLQSEIQLSAGAHAVAFRPLLGTAVQLDEFTICPGAGRLQQGAGTSPVSWLTISPAPWSASEDAPPGLPGSAGWTGDYPFAWAACVLPPDYKLEGWVKAVGTGCSVSGEQYGSALYRQPSPDWQRIRITPLSRWVSFGSFAPDGSIQLELKVAGITVSPAGIGEILDAPELTWSAAGSQPFELSSLESAPHGSGSFYVQAENPFEASVSTSLNGPGKLYFSPLGGGHEGSFWRVSLNGAITTGLYTTQWQRVSVRVPAGHVAAEISAVNEGPYSYAYLDDVTWCVAANAAQKDALDVPVSAEVWVRKSAASLWTRTAAVSHDGVDALSLASSPVARRAELVLPAAESRLAGIWIKTSPGTELAVSRIGRQYPDYERFRPAGGGDWTWTAICTGTGITELSFAVPPDADAGGELYLDDYRLYNTAVPLAEALDTPGMTWTGPGGGLALPGSDAIGEKAVLLDAGIGGNSVMNTVSVPVSGPFRLKYRYRYGVGAFYTRWQFSLGPGLVLSEIDSSGVEPTAWREGELTSYGGQENASLRIRCEEGILLLDKVEIIPLTGVTIPEALDAPELTVAGANNWRGLAGLGHDGLDAVISPVMLRASHFPNTDPQQSTLAVNTPGGRSLDGGFWWKRESPLTSLQLQSRWESTRFGRFSYTGSGYTGFGWQRVRLHCDRADAPIKWTQTMQWQYTSATAVPAGNVLLDELSLQSGEEDTFSKALDTDGAGPNVAATGWESIGEAAVAVQTAVAWQGGDALEIRATPGGEATQSTVIFSRFHGGTDFSCRVKRGPLSGGTVTLMIEEMPYAEAPLTADWTEFRTLLPASHSTGDHWIGLLVTVPDAGPGAAVYLDAVSFTEATDFNFALDTNGLTWSAAGEGRQVIAGERVLEYGLFPPYYGFVDGVSMLGLESGQRRWLETVMTGPGTVVLTGYRPPAGQADWRARLLVDGVARDSIPSVGAGVFYLQAMVPAGPHTVRYLVERGTDGVTEPAVIQLHSAALIPGLTANLLPAALEVIAPGRAWVTGGTHPPVPLYSLYEGFISVRGLRFPVSTPAETSWIETAVTGPATLNFTWQSAVIAACYIDGRTACRTVLDSFGGYAPDPRTALHVPAGAHTLRWASAQGIPAELRAFSATPGSDIAGVLGSAPPQVVWLHEPEFPYRRPWQAVTDGLLTAYANDGTLLSVPGTGLPVLGAGDTTAGAFWVTGPAVVSYDVRRATWVPLVVRVDSEAYSTAPHFPEEPADLGWRPEAIVVPTGQHLVSFNVEEDDAGQGPYLLLKNIRIEPGVQWLTWAFGIGLIDINDSRPYADPDNDGVNNLMEFAFGTQPRSSSAPVAPLLTGPPENPRLQFPVLPWDATGLTYNVESSADLESWTAWATVRPSPAGQPGPSVPLPPAAQGRKFYRVTVRL